MLNGRANDRGADGHRVAADDFGEDEWYDAQKAQLQKQQDINAAEFDTLDEGQRVKIEGYRAGKYARLVIKGVPAEFVAGFRPSMPLIVGGLSATEDRFAFVQCRLKRHRWHKKIVSARGQHGRHMERRNMLTEWTAEDR